MGSIASAPQRRACIVGHTGFVGANLFRSDRFGLGVDTASIHRLEGRSFDLLVCAAPHAKKWWANRHPEEDRAIVQGLAEQLSRADAEHVVLLSTIDVFPRLTDIDDSFDGDWSDNHPYGCHRRELEVLVRESFARVTVVRLPGLFGPGLKKNVLFDLMNQRLLDGIHPDSAFQWYDVSELWKDIGRITEAGVDTIVLATEPVRTGEIISRFFPEARVDSKASDPVEYEVRTCFDGIFGRHDGFVRGADEVLLAMEKFFSSHSGKS